MCHHFDRDYCDNCPHPIRSQYVPPALRFVTHEFANHEGHLVVQEPTSNLFLKNENKCYSPCASPSNICIWLYLFSERRIIRLIISNRSVSEFMSLSVSANRSSNDLLTTGESFHNAPPDDDSIGIIFLLFTNMIPWPRNRNVKFLSKAVSIIRLPSSDMNFGLKIKNSSIECDAVPSL